MAFQVRGNPPERYRRILSDLNDLYNEMSINWQTINQQIGWYEAINHRASVKLKRLNEIVYENLARGIIRMHQCGRIEKQRQDKEAAEQKNLQMMSAGQFMPDSK